MTAITVRIDEETKKLMKELDINWSEFIRDAIRRKIDDERIRDLARAVLITERVREKSRGEMRSEETIRSFRERRYGKDIS